MYLACWVSKFGFCYRREVRPINPRIRPFENQDTDAVVSLSLRAWAPVFASIQRAMESEVYEQFYPEGWRESQRRAV